MRLTLAMKFIPPSPDTHDNISLKLISNQNIIDWDMHQLDEKANKSHDQKSDPGCTSNLCELLTVGLGAFFDEVDRVLGELTERLDEDLVETFFFCHDLWILGRLRCDMGFGC